MTVTHSSPACFVTGTDTEIGKTLVASALLHFLGRQGLRTVGMKPVAAGAELVDGVLCNEDVDALAACSSEQPPLEMRTPYLLRTAAAPHIAAELEGVRIDGDEIVARFQRLRALADACVVEGVGGFRVPLNDDEDTAGLAVRLGLPVVMVVGLRLGCINQALLTQEAIAARGLRLVGWVANRCTADMAFADENVAAIRRRIPAPLLGVVPRVAGADAAQRARQAADHLDAEALFRVFALNRS